MSPIFRRIYNDVTDLVNCVPLCSRKTRAEFRRLILTIMHTTIMAYRNNPAIEEDLQHAIDFGGLDGRD
jgi:hypothetical protein